MSNRTRPRVEAYKKQLNTVEPTDRHNEVLNGALALFALHGFAHVSLRDLGARLGISAGSLYHHVDSKDALLHELIESLYMRLLANARQVQQRGLPVVQCLDALIETHLNLHDTMAQHFKVAEHDFHYLSEGHQTSILALRRCYEAIFAKALQGLHGPDAAGPADIAAGLVLLLNQLPARLRSPHPSTPRSKRFLISALCSIASAAGTLKTESAV